MKPWMASFAPDARVATRCSPRTTLRLEAKSERFSAVIETIDSRQKLADTDTPIDAGMVNALELLQGYGAIRFDGPFATDSRSELRLGRQTMDVGSRRLVARNNFRNTELPPAGWTGGGVI